MIDGRRHDDDTYDLVEDTFGLATDIGKISSATEIYFRMALPVLVLPSDFAGKRNNGETYAGSKKLRVPDPATLGWTATGSCSESAVQFFVREYEGKPPDGFLLDDWQREDDPRRRADFPRGGADGTR